MGTTPRRIIFIGECRLDIAIKSDGTISATPGGNMLKAAINLAQKGLDVAFVGEAGCDIPGNTIVDALSRVGVDTECIDRFPDGATTIDLICHGGNPEGEFYTKTPKENLVVKWPRIVAGDIVVFGNWFALSGRTKGAVDDLVQYASSRGAMVVYLPGFATQLEPALTHVMTQILDYLELADMVVMFNDDYQSIFSEKDSQECYRRRINFYCPTMVHINPANQSVEIYNEAERIPMEIATDKTEFCSTTLASLLQHLATDSVLTSKQLPSLVKTWNPEL